VPAPAERKRLEAAVTTGRATTHMAWADPDSTTAHPFAALLPVPHGQSTADALVIVGDARTPFAVLDVTFLSALGQQVGGALANSALTERLRQRSTELERLSTRMLQQHEEERRRLSRELHDETAQVLSALKIELGVLRRVVATADQHRVDDALTLVDVGIRSIRAVTNELRPALLDDLGLVPALRSLVTEFSTRTQMDVRLALPPDGSIPPLAPDAELALFRALQEGLANIARHAQARHIEIALAAYGSEVILTVADDGVGFTPGTHATGGMGLTGMRERVAAEGGSVTIEPRASGGTALRITLGTRKAE
jgi:signal transduction histidine kinase